MSAMSTVRRSFQPLKLYRLLAMLGGFLAGKRDFVEADAALHEAETIFRKLLQPSHLWLGDRLRNQAISFYRQDRFGEAQNKVSET